MTQGVLFKVHLFTQENLLINVLVILENVIQAKDIRMVGYH